MPGPVLLADRVSKVYRRGRVDVDVLRDVSLAAERGRSIAITGPSGSGKTTLLNLLAGLDRPTAGAVAIDGHPLAAVPARALTAFRRRNVGFVFQFFNLLPTMTARDNVALPLLAERVPTRDVATRVAEVLDAVGVMHRAAHRPDEMSGGEQQRVAIARALVMRPRVLLADEPTGNLDRATGRDILTLLRRLCDDGQVTIVMVTHSHEAATSADRELVMQDGRLVEERNA